MGQVLHRNRYWFRDTFAPGHTAERTGGATRGKDGTSQPRAEFDTIYSAPAPGEAETVNTSSRDRGVLRRKT